jgi:NAD+ kinase
MLVGIIGNVGKPDLPSAARALAAILEQRSIGMVLHESLRPVPELEGLGEYVTDDDMRRQPDVVVAFGGDGTMLATSRMLAGSGVPLMGVNLGKLGFLAELSLDCLEETIDDFRAGACPIVVRSLLCATFPDNSDQEPLIGLNDIVIDKTGTTRILRVETYINGDYLGTYVSDGLILATPTGSTAYALAVGGPVVTPNSQVTVIAPIAPHMLTARPVIVPNNAVIDIYPKLNDTGDMARIIADGQVTRNIQVPTRVSITRHEATACLVKRTSTTYFDVLRAKLLWGREPVLNTQQSTTYGKF